MAKIKLDIRPRDVADVMELVEKRVGRRSKQPVDMVMLALLAAENVVLLVKSHWNYEEDFESKMYELREVAKITALEMSRGVLDDE